MTAPTTTRPPGSASRSPRAAVDVDVQHHHDEQEQHHHRADVDEHERDGEELGLQQHPHAGGVEEGEHEVQRGMHRTARRDDRKRTANSSTAEKT
jgi:hypothetical protein